MKQYLSYLILALGIAFAGAMIPYGVSKFKSYDRTVSVKGLCEREMAADKVIWPMNFKVVGNDLATIYNEIESKNKCITTFLKKGGIQSEEIFINAPKLNDKYAQDYGGNDRPYRYVATCTVTVCTQKVSEVLKLMEQQASLIKENIVFTNEWDSKTQFKFEALNDVKPEMIEEATRNAREVAQKFADNSGSRLGKIKDAAQGTFSIEDRDSNTPQIKKLRIVTYVTYYLSK